MKNFLSKLWKIIRVILVIILICLAIYLMVTTGTLWFIGLAGVSGGWGAALCIGVAFLIDPDETGKQLTDIGESIGEAAGSVLGALGSALASTGIFGWIAAGVAFWWFFLSDDSKESRDKARAALSDRLPGRRAA